MYLVNDNDVVNWMIAMCFEPKTNWDKIGFNLFVVWREQNKIKKLFTGGKTMQLIILIICSWKYFLK
jgi:hypothetical protein